LVPNQPVIKPGKITTIYVPKTYQVNEWNFRPFVEFTGPYPHTVDISPNKSATLEKYALTDDFYTKESRMPLNWYVLGSDNRNNWYVLDRKNDQEKWGQLEEREFTIPNAVGFKTYRFLFQSNNPTTLRIGRLKAMVRGGLNPEEKSALSRYLEVKSVLSIDGAQHTEYSIPFMENDISSTLDIRVNGLGSLPFMEVATPYPHTLDIEINRPLAIKGYTIGKDAYSEKGERMPTNWLLLGTDDEETWYVLDRRESETGWKPSERRRYELPRPVGFARYRLLFLDGETPLIIRFGHFGAHFEDEGAGVNKKGLTEFTGKGYGLPSETGDLK
jgi:hypothetical protein